jgi:AcrR family transcriptional regulator
VTGPSPTATRRRYDNTRRLEQAAQTRARIVTAATELLRDSSIRDWRGLTVRSVADRAGVNERTVFRHFSSERALRDAVMHRLEQQAGVDLAELRLDGVADAAARILRHVARYPPGPRPDLDPTLADANRRQHEALLTAVADSAGSWAGVDQTIAAAVLDVLWSVGSYERLATDWDLGPDDAVRGLVWVIELVRRAISEDHPPLP